MRVTGLVEEMILHGKCYDRKIIEISMPWWQYNSLWRELRETCPDMPEEAPKSFEFYGVRIMNNWGYSTTFTYDK